MINQYDESIHDGIIFLNDVELFSYTKKSKPIQSHEIGLKYHIVLDENPPVHFEAIIGNPIHYVKNLLKSNCNGMIAKKTKSSSKFIKDVMKKLNG